MILCASAGYADMYAPDAIATAIPTAVPAAPTEPPAPGSFTIRNGIRWNMSAQEVQIAEGQQMVPRINGEWSILYPPGKVEVSRYTADLVFMFWNDRLKMITYTFGADAANGTFAYLTGALTAVYGEEMQSEPAEIVAVMNLINPGYYRPEQLSQVHGWAAADGTRVYLYHYSDAGFEILYAAGDVAKPGSGNYNTNGL